MVENETLFKGDEVADIFRCTIAGVLVSYEFPE